MRLVVVATISLLAACGGDDHSSQLPGDAADLDAPSFPAPPALGAQLGRAGRPMVKPVLIGLLEPSSQRVLALRDAYDRAADPSGWAQAVLDPSTLPPTTIHDELAANLGVLDGVDVGHPDIVQAGCGNTPLYEGPPTTSSYQQLAAILADDQLYLDTERTVCDRYFALELAAISKLPSTRCGGRTLSHDVADHAYSLWMGGTAAFDPDPTGAPRIGDGAPPHADVDDATFPFLASPR